MAKWISLFILIHILSILLIIGLSAMDIFNDGVDFILKIHGLLVPCLSLYFFLKKENQKGWANMFGYGITLIIGFIVFVILFLESGI